MIEFGDERAVSIMREPVIIGGVEVGLIWPTDYGFQCQFQAKKCGGKMFGSLNGVGKTREEAILDAILTARKEAESLVAAADFVAEALRDQAYQKDLDEGR